MEGVSGGGQRGSVGGGVVSGDVTLTTATTRAPASSPPHATQRRLREAEAQLGRNWLMRIKRASLAAAICASLQTHKRRVGYRRLLVETSRHLHLGISLLSNDVASRRFTFIHSPFLN